MAAALLSISGCASMATHSINYASSSQSKGVYKYAEISVVSKNDSALQRFYAQYPSDKYEVIAYESVRKRVLNPYWVIPFAIAGAVIGGVSAGNMFHGEYDFERRKYKTSAPAVLGGITVGASLFSVLGYWAGNTNSSKYIITYIER